MASSSLPVSFTASGNCSVSGSTVSVTGIGSCTVTAHQSGNGNWNAAPDVSQTFNIVKTLAQIFFSTLNHIYDATGKSATVTTTPSGLSVLLTYGNDATTTLPVDVGSYLVEATINDTNYSGNASSTLIISPATLSVSGITASDKVYDGTTAATISTTSASLIGLTATDTPSVTLDLSGAVGNFNNADVGSGKMVTITGAILSGARAFNYILDSITTTASITAVPVPVPPPSGGGGGGGGNGPIAGSLTNGGGSTGGTGGGTPPAETGGATGGNPVIVNEGAGAGAPNEQAGGNAGAGGQNTNQGGGNANLLANAINAVEGAGASNVEASSSTAASSTNLNQTATAIFGGKWLNWRNGLYALGLLLLLWLIIFLYRRRKDDEENINKKPGNNRF